MNLTKLIILLITPILLTLIIPGKGFSRYGPNPPPPKVYEPPAGRLIAIAHGNDDKSKNLNKYIKEQTITANLKHYDAIILIFKAIKSAEIDQVREANDMLNESARLLSEAETSFNQMSELIDPKWKIVLSDDALKMVQSDLNKYGINTVPQSSKGWFILTAKEIGLLRAVVKNAKFGTHRQGVDSYKSITSGLTRLFDVCSAISEVNLVGTISK